MAAGVREYCLTAALRGLLSHNLQAVVKTWQELDGAYQYASQEICGTVLFWSPRRAGNVTTQGFPRRGGRKDGGRNITTGLWIC